MYALLKKIDAIEAKAKELLIKWNTLKQENEVLARENELLKIELKQHKDRIEELTLSQFADIKQSDNNSIAVRQELRRLIEEVDECIKLAQNI